MFNQNVYIPVKMTDFSLVSYEPESLRSSATTFDCKASQNPINKSWTEHLDVQHNKRYAATSVRLYIQY